MFSGSTCLVSFDALFNRLETDLGTAVGTCVTGLVEIARTTLEDAHADIAKERAQGLAEVAEERAKAIAEVDARQSEVDARRAELGREVAIMHKHKEAQEGRIELNIGGFRFETSVQALRRIPHTFFDAYFSCRYAQACVMTAASLWTETASTSVTSSSTCGTA
jgi:hypothetical protein